MIYGRTISDIVRIAWRIIRIVIRNDIALIMIFTRSYEQSAHHHYTDDVGNYYRYNRVGHSFCLFPCYNFSIK